MGTFFKKWPPNFLPPPPPSHRPPFYSVPNSHQIPIFQQHDLTNFEKIKWLKKLYTGSAIDHVLQSFEVYFQWENKFFPIYLTVVTRYLKPEKMLFFQKSWPTQQQSFFTRKMIVWGWSLPYLEVNSIYKWS